MFFKRLTKTKSAPATPAEIEQRLEKASPAPEVKVGPRPLPAAELRRTVDSKTLGFTTTANLDVATGLAGQERALAAIDFGLSMRARDFNIFVVGPPTSGKSAAVRAHLAKIAAASQTPTDWVYVNNFDDPRRPRALSLPAGRAEGLAQGVLAALREMAASLPTAFGSEDYRARRRAIEEEFRAGQEDALDALNARAAQQNIAVLRTPLGFGMAPMHDGKVVRPEVFNQLPEAMRRDVEKRITALQTELEAILASAPKADKRRRQQLAELNEETARHVVEEALDALSASFADLPEVASFLADIEKDLVASSALFAIPEAEAKTVAAQIDPAQDARLRRYLVNVVVSHKNAKAGAPVCEASDPTLTSLAGWIEPATQGGAADFLAIRPGALHRANGGALMIEARRLFASPRAWEGLKRALEAGEVRVEVSEPTTASGATPVPTLEPEPIPLAIKIVLLVDPELLATIEQTDPDFAQLFKVQADFDETLGRSADNDRIFARLVATIVETHGLKPIDAGGVARLMEEAARMAEDRDKLLIETGRLADIVREADYWADGENRKVTSAADITRALTERTRRTDRLREHLQESVARGVVLVDTAGSKVGQINALSLVQKGQLSFGRPARITARVHLGQGRVTDIEREVELGGPLHSKGVMILWGYLAGRFAQDVPLALAATLVFEQSYDTIEGDSASAAELLALLSALADAPLNQEIAVTGSINQWGEVQAVGGVNEKIEGFFDICAARGLTRTQGVLIPEANKQHLMLREDVVAAVREGRFAIYAIKTIDEGLALLTGLEAGKAGADGRFGADTVNGRVEARLKAFAERARSFASSKAGAPGAGSGAA
ncbi:ATP-binding protein [Hyphomicrobium sp.]|uniref:Lon protease family protein n=1 Tax=Hyphomicrobium sp. TaxID=82 RepID=UPI0025BEA40B|nr:ATP-binding protein [Hyphomicrobium sp.]MCC7252790.1 AAA family ATPase [Hyphomicrobium sp.]